MTALSAILLSGHRREALGADVRQLLERHVEQRAGLRGVAWRSGLALLRAARPGVVERAVERLLPECLDALEPLYHDYRAGSERDFGLYLQRHAEPAVARLLAVVDRRAAGAATATRRLYARFRAEAHTEALALFPAFARLLAGHLE